MRMISHNSYMATPPDMSGSVSKNRFRVELLWGLEKLLDCLDLGIDNFAVVFDYRCDIELHLDEGYEFYQVKTGSSNSFGVSWACKKNPKTKVSVVGRLYELHDAAGDGSIRMVIVGNRRFINKGKNLEEPGELFFSSLKDEDKTRISEAIENHLPDVQPDLSKISYLLVAMDLARPADSIKGHLVRTFEGVRNCEVRKPNALYRALSDLATDRACEEKTQQTYKDVIAKKAITSADVNRLFDCYEDRERSLQDFVFAWIKRQPPLQQNGLKCAYETIVENILKPRGRRPIDVGLEYVVQLDNSLCEDEIIEIVSNHIRDACGIEVTQDMRKIYAVTVLYEAMKKDQT